MQHPRIVYAAVGVAVVAAVGGGVAAAAGGGSSGYGGSTSAAPAQSAAAATVRTMPATVGGQSQTILVDASGMPLYYYQPDTATSSAVSGGLAAAWPPVTGSPTSTSLAGGQLGSIQDAHGTHTTFNGHPLYTFVSDHPGVVTGQGVQNFFVATPNLAPLAGGPAPATSSSGSSGYSY